jgi:hypothetical protein
MECMEGRKPIFGEQKKVGNRCGTSPRRIFKNPLMQFNDHMRQQNFNEWKMLFLKNGMSTIGREVIANPFHN